MIKIIFCIRKLPGLTDGEFQRYWREDHADLVRQGGRSSQHPPLCAEPRLFRSAPDPDDRTRAGLKRRLTMALPSCGGMTWTPFLLRVRRRRAVPRGGALLEDEKRFIDLKASPLFYAYEHEIIALTD